MQNENENIGIKGENCGLKVEIGGGKILILFIDQFTLHRFSQWHLPEEIEECNHNSHITKLLSYLSHLFLTDD